MLYAQSPPVPVLRMWEQTWGDVIRVEPNACLHQSWINQNILQISLNTDDGRQCQVVILYIWILKT